MKKHKKQDFNKLMCWQDRFTVSESAYRPTLSLMDERETYYKGSREMTCISDDDRSQQGEATHVNNIVAENIESEIDSSIPQPKVTARRQKDEQKATLIENMLRNELNRLPFETMNDLMERMVPNQGGSFYHVEWDNSESTHSTVGELDVSTRHAKQLIPQDGVYELANMDYFFLKIPQTKEYIRRRYDVDVSGEAESDPEVKGGGGSDNADDLVTQIVCYYRNEKGGIGLFSWVNDIVVEDLEDYQARRLRRCTKCGALEPVYAEPLEKPTEDGSKPDGPPDFDFDHMADFPAGVPLEYDADVSEDKKRPSEKNKKDVCPYCGGIGWSESEEEYEEVLLPRTTAHGATIPGAQAAVDESGMSYMAPTRIPFYKPDVYPVVLVKNVSVYGQLLGDSDVDKIMDQQKTHNRLSKKILDRIVKAGTRVTLPSDAMLTIDGKDSEVWRIQDPSAKSMIDVYEFSGDLQYEFLYRAEIYEEARRNLGITDSFQGRNDSTAQSGKAKQFAAAQSAGRLESKRIMKNAAYAELFEIMFKFRLAYTDEPRTVVAKDKNSNDTYDTFDRYDFLEQDADGQWYWNDEFLFSCDSSSGLATNREALWQETRENYSSGAFGDPGSIDTLILMWTILEEQHYPLATTAKNFLEEVKAQQQAQAQAQMQMQMQMQQQAQGQAQQAGQARGEAKNKAAASAEQSVLKMVDEQARRDAAATAAARKGAGGNAGGQAGGNNPGNS